MTCARSGCGHQRAATGHGQTQNATVLVVALSVGVPLGLTLAFALWARRPPPADGTASALPSWIPRAAWALWLGLASWNLSRRQYSAAAFTVLIGLWAHLMNWRTQVPSVDDETC